MKEVAFSEVCETVKDFSIDIDKDTWIQKFPGNNDIFYCQSAGDGEFIATKIPMEKIVVRFPDMAGK